MRNEQIDFIEEDSVKVDVNGLDDPRIASLKSELDFRFLQTERLKTEAEAKAKKLIDLKAKMPTPRNYSPSRAKHLKYIELHALRELIYGDNINTVLDILENLENSSANSSEEPQYLKNSRCALINLKADYSFTLKDLLDYLNRKTILSDFPNISALAGVGVILSKLQPSKIRSEVGIRRYLIKEFGFNQQNLTAAIVLLFEAFGDLEALELNDFFIEWLKIKYPQVAIHEMKTRFSTDNDHSPEGSVNEFSDVRNSTVAQKKGIMTFEDREMLEELETVSRNQPKEKSLSTARIPTKLGTVVMFEERHQTSLSHERLFEEKAKTSYSHGELLDKKVKTFSSHKELLEKKVNTALSHGEKFKPKIKQSLNLEGFSKDPNIQVYENNVDHNIKSVSKFGDEIEQGNAALAIQRIYRDRKAKIHAKIQIKESLPAHAEPVISSNTTLDLNKPAKFIQKAIRRFMNRKKSETRNEFVKIENDEKSYNEPNPDPKFNCTRADHNNSAIKIQRRYRAHVEKMKNVQLISLKAIEPDNNRSVILMQKVVRGFIARRLILKKIRTSRFINRLLKVLISTQVSSITTEAQLSLVEWRHLSQEHKAALKIQQIYKKSHAKKLRTVLKIYKRYENCIIFEVFTTEATELRHNLIDLGNEGSLLQDQELIEGDGQDTQSNVNDSVGGSVSNGVKSTHQLLDKNTEEGEELDYDRFIGQDMKTESDNIDPEPYENNDELRKVLLDENSASEKDPDSYGYESQDIIQADYDQNEPVDENSDNFMNESGFEEAESSIRSREFIPHAQSDQLQNKKQRNFESCDIQEEKSKSETASLTPQKITKALSKNLQVSRSQNDLRRELNDISFEPKYETNFYDRFPGHKSISSVDDELYYNIGLYEKTTEAIMINLTNGKRDPYSSFSEMMESGQRSPSRSVISETARAREDEIRSYLVDLDKKPKKTKFNLTHAITQIKNSEVRSSQLEDSRTSVKAHPHQFGATGMLNIKPRAFGYTGSVMQHRAYQGSIFSRVNERELDTSNILELQHLMIEAGFCTKKQAKEREVKLQGFMTGLDSSNMKSGSLFKTSQLKR